MPAKTTDKTVETTDDPILAFNQRVVALQAELRAPKNQRNNFGKYNYRSCEDILEAVKPLLHKYGLVLNITDDIVQRGERFYVKATATLMDAHTESIKTILSSSAYAREEEEKKGMDSSQLTGSTSSYARKYALNGLLLIDDAKDADTEEQANAIEGNRGGYTDAKTSLVEEVQRRRAF